MRTYLDIDEDASVWKHTTGKRSEKVAQFHTLTEAMAFEVRNLPQTKPQSLKCLYYQCLLRFLRFLRFFHPPDLKNHTASGSYLRFPDRDESLTEKMKKRGGLRDAEDKTVWAKALAIIRVL